MSRDGPGLLLRDILEDDAQIASAVAVIGALDADLLLLGDIDWDASGAALDALAGRIGGYPHRLAWRPNSGLDSGADLDGDGRLGEPEDSQGYGRFTGNGGMAILSRVPLDVAAGRDFSGFLWKDLPGGLVPPGASPDQRLPSKGHWAVPATLPDGRRITVLAFHASPHVFDGPEDRNGRRNHDEAALWHHLLAGGFGPPPDLPVLLGFANLDAAEEAGRPAALRALLAHPLLRDPRPASSGGRAAAAHDGGVNDAQRGDPALDTTDWDDGANAPGNLRTDYILPSTALGVAAAGVFWPDPATPSGRDVRTASRHRPVWIDLELGRADMTQIRRRDF